ncbi:type II toxin-antitoxin system RelE/ParE family toxin [Sphingomonas sp. UYP23]
MLKLAGVSSRATVAMPYRLSQPARRDLDEIYIRGAELFGIAQADEYSAGMAQTLTFLASYPRAARERTEIVPPMRAHRYKAHVVIYRLEEDGILILRVRHGHEDWTSNPV